MMQAEAMFFDRKLGLRIAGEIKRTYHADVARFLGGELFPAAGYDLSDRVAVLDIPVLVLNGRQDPMDTYMAYVTAKAFKHSTLEFVDRAGHFPWFEQPTQFNADLTAFLNRSE